MTVTEARQAVRTCGLAADDVRIVAAGWDNTIVRVDEDWVFRFPRRSIALPGIDREIALLPKLAPQLSLPGILRVVLKGDREPFALGDVRFEFNSAA